MEYSIKITDYGCIETIKINGKKYKKRTKKTKFGCMPLDDDFKDQMAKMGLIRKLRTLYMIYMMDSPVLQISWNLQKLQKKTSLIKKMEITLPPNL